jgi:hypothetical protein
VESLASRDEVETVLERQIQIIGPSSISLGSLWRAAGRPPGSDPEIWIRLALPAITGLANYRASLRNGGFASTDGQPMLWRWNDPDAEPWRQGDLIATEPIARLYAAYLRSAGA